MVRFLTLITVIFLSVGCSSKSATNNSATNNSASNDSPAQPADSASRPVNDVVTDIDDETQKTAMAELDSIRAEFQTSVEELKALIAKIDSKEEQLQTLVDNNPAQTFGPKFMALAKKYPGTKASVDATLFVVSVVAQNSSELKIEAMNFLLGQHADKVKLSAIAESLKKEVPRPEIEKWFSTMIEEAKPGPVKASVMLSYSQYVGQLPFFRRTIEMNPQIVQRLSDSQLEYINSPRTEAQDEELASILQTLIDEFGETKYKGRETFGDVATRELFELQRLQVGMVAPEIEGNDLDDISFKLSDYRGKVVMLDFWGHWCPPCRAMYSHEQEVARKLADKPFVLIGVNSDGDKDTAIDAVRSESLSWRHFWNGPQGTRGPISKRWNVEGWPTVYLIDQKGVIRFKEVLGKDIDRGLEILMLEMGHDVILSDDTQ